MARPRSTRHRPRDRPASRSLADSLATPAPSLLLVLLNLVVYLSIRHAQFVSLDDPVYVTNNPNVQAGLSWSNAVWAFTTGHAPYWHPITWLSHMLDVQWFGLDAGAHHVTNLCWQIANTQLLFVWLRRATRTMWPPLAVAALFAVHPLHVESVAWITERKDLLSGFFWLLTLLAYTTYVARPTAWRYAASLGAFSLGLMSKPSVVSLPIILLLVDLWPLQRLTMPLSWSAVRPALVDKVPFVILAAASSVATVLIQSHVGALSSFDSLPLAARASNAVVAYVLYLGKAIWPVDLAVFYPLRTWPMWAVAAAVLAIAAGTALAIAVRRTRPYVLVGWLWYLVSLVPMIGLLQVGAQGFADRFMYLPMIGLLMLLVWTVADASVRWPRVFDKTVVGTFAVATILALTVDARSLAATWSDDATLWRHAIASTRDNYLAYVNLGSALARGGDLAGAVDAYKRGLAAIGPKWPEQRASIETNIGMAHLRQGDLTEAETAFAEAARLNPALSEARLGSAEVLQRAGHPAEAIHEFDAALQLNPNLVGALIGKGGALMDEHQPAAAIPYYVRASHLDPAVAETHSALGAAYALTGQNDAALGELEAAIKLEPDLTPAYLNEGVLLASEGRTEEARHVVERLLSIDPSNEAGRRLLLSMPNR